MCGQDGVESVAALNSVASCSSSQTLEPGAQVWPFWPLSETFPLRLQQKVEFAQQDCAKA